MTTKIKAENKTLRARPDVWTKFKILASAENLKLGELLSIMVDDYAQKRGITFEGLMNTSPNNKD